MSKFVKNTHQTLGWQRKPGPPKVWRTVEGRKEIEAGKKPKFIIQEVPEDRYDDVLDLMRTVYLAEEALCRYLGVKDDPEAIKDFTNAWNFALQQGVVTGAFVVEDDNPKPVLAGVTMTLICTEATEKCLDLIETTSERGLKFLEYIQEFEKDIKTRQFYDVDAYVTGFGFCVDPRYRGQGLANALIKSREDVAQAYNIGAMSASYTAVQAVQAATKAGWEILAKGNIEDTRNDDGTERSPGKLITPCTFMGKRTSQRK